MTARRLTRLDVVDEGMVARLSRRSRRVRMARLWRGVAECLVGSLIALAAAIVAVKYACCIATMIP